MLIEICEAEVYILQKSEGGIQDMFDGMRPSFNINGELILCFVYSLSGQERMLQGHSYKVRLELPYGEKVGVAKFIKRGAKFRLQFGAKTIATGCILNP